MTIAIVTNNSNGLYLFRRHLINALIKKGEKVYAITPFDDDVDNLRSLGITMIETDVDRRGTNLVRDLVLLKDYHVILSKIHPDLVITYTIKPNIYAGLTCRQLGIPYVINITGLGTAFENNGFLRKTVALLYKGALKRAKVVFFENSDNLRTFTEEGIIPKDKTCLLNGAGVDTEYFCYQDYPSHDNEFKFLFIGRVMKEKGIDELLDAMERLRKGGTSCTLDILGDFEENYKTRIEEAEKAGWLQYHGRQQDVRPFIRECNCFVLPSYHEGMANTNLECASSGRPIITSNIPGCKEAVLDGRSGFVCEVKNTVDLYEKMERMIFLSLERRIEMGRIGREHMIKQFDKRKVVEKTINRLPIIK